MSRGGALAFALVLLCACASPEKADDPPPPAAAGCGKEVRDCDPGEPEPEPARCNRRSYELAIANQIDDGGFAFREVACDGEHLTLRVDVGAGLCPPEATKEERRECAREKVAFFVARKGAWEIVTYAERGDCATVQSIEPGFPDSVCDP